MHRYCVSRLPGRAPRCGARTRKAGCFASPAMLNGRCRMHGGMSTGPQTAAGLARCRKALTKHGEFSAEALTHRRQITADLRTLRATLDHVQKEIARHSQRTPGTSEKT